MTKSLLSFIENTSDFYYKEWMNKQSNYINIRTCKIVGKKYGYVIVIAQSYHY